MIFFIVEKDSKFIRFHAMQSIIVFGACTVTHIIISNIVPMPAFIRWIPVSCIIAATFILWLVIMMNAYYGQWSKLPWAGNIAENQASIGENK